jgi:hypothetical protein
MGRKRKPHQPRRIIRFHAPKPRTAQPTKAEMRELGQAAVRAGHPIIQTERPRR